jgi:hypothetical protein
MLSEVFLDAGLNQSFEHDGFVVLQNFYTEADIEAVAKVYYALYKEVAADGMWASNYAYSEEYQRPLTDLLMEISVPKLQRWFNDCRIITGVIMDKFKGPSSESLPHRDWTITDETKYDGWLIWSPLQDITRDNGMLYALPGSHKRFYGVQAAVTPWPYLPFTDIIKKYSRELLLRRGDAVVYSNRLIHGSYPNTTNERRPIITMGCLQREADLLYFYKDKQQANALIEIYKVHDISFFHQHDHQTRPKDLKLLGTTLDGYERFTAQSFEQACRELANN